MLTGKNRNVEEEVVQGVEEEEGEGGVVVVGTKIMKMKDEASIEDQVHSDDLLKDQRMI